jgi:two-component system, OmpR family, response regulator
MRADVVAAPRVFEHGIQHRIALYEPDTLRAAVVAGAFAGSKCEIIALGDPAISVRDWLNTAYDIVLINPFTSVAEPAVVIGLCRRIANLRPVFALTAQHCSSQRTLAIAAGADDAMDPLSASSELAIRLGALLRRRAVTVGQLACDDLKIDLIRRSVARGSRTIAMPAREFELLAELAQTPDQIVPRGHLLRSVWRLDFDPGTNRVEVHMSRLRGKLDQHESFAMLRTFKGEGYALVSRAGILSNLGMVRDRPHYQAQHAPLTV